ncbi:Nmral1 [Symbiodinium pilosum]|uniref:Nmral1 protein n=1 Tax=Symbiodinium pilosum TaxID=2952 RepID=A0A812PV19_SYMPI|nr:Nmral1 [Symbiodinium pilosum]
MINDCGKKSLRVCAKINERESYNWEKHLMMQDYLLSPQAFTHVLMLDADAALIQPQLDTLRRIAAILDRKGKDLFLTNEDWLDKNGEARINGGLMLAKNTPFTQNLFQDTFDAHVAGYKLLKKARIGTPVIRCTSNEQICLNDLYYGDTEHFTSKVIMASGKKYNRGAERGGEAHITDETTEIMHWMGGAKATAGQALCQGKRDLTFGGPDATSYRLIEAVINTTKESGAIRHGAECFNFYFPQELDTNFLVVWEGFDDKPWAYMDEDELRDFLQERVEEDSYAMPLNPIWCIRDCGWYDLMESQMENPLCKAALEAWYPQQSGIFEKIKAARIKGAVQACLSELRQMGVVKETFP